MFGQVHITPSHKNISNHSSGLDAERPKWFPFLGHPIYAEKTFNFHLKVGDHAQGILRINTGDIRDDLIFDVRASYELGA